MEPYTLFALSRIGAASGYKRIGKIDWFARSYDYLCSSQSPSGAWSTNYLPEVSGTALGLLCLEYGRAPAVINKLDYANNGALSPAVAHWNERPQDCFNFVSWLGRSLESRFNWQIVTLASPAEELESAPILFISGNEKVAFSPEAEGALRRFVQQGGLILGNADCGSPAFTASFNQLAADLFPAYHMRDLPSDHPIYTEEQYPAKRWKMGSPLRGVSNGVRELMLLPSADLSVSFQRQNDVVAAEHYELACDLTLYTTDKVLNHKFGETRHVTENQSAPASRTIRVARLQYDGNWDPEPDGWPRLAAIMHNQYQTLLKIETDKLGDGTLKEACFAHLTGTDEVHLTAGQRRELTDFLAAGGLLCVDAAGGSTAFADSIGPELSAIAGSTPAQAFSSPIPADDELYNLAGFNISSVSFWHFARTHLTGSNKTPMLYQLRRDGLAVIYFSRLDLSAGLVGQPVDGIVGYSSDSAVALMRNMLLNYAASHH